MAHRLCLGLIVSTLAFTAWACSPATGKHTNLNNNNRPQVGCTEITNPNCDIYADDDNDHISNGDEGCQCDLNTDNDSFPNYLDHDSDNDGVNDIHEAGDADLMTPPVDSDGDNIPDYLDRDSDDDGVIDGDEDRNNDGKLGKCEDNPVYCSGSCVNPEATCHPLLGICIDPICLNGETDPRLKDTDGDGVPDGQESTFICNAATEEQQGRRPVQYAKHLRGLFQIAIEMEAQYYTTDPSNPGSSEGAGSFDMTAEEHSSAGFVVSREATDELLGLEVRNAIVTLQSLGSTATLSGGSVNLSHANEEQVVNVTLRLETSSSLNPGQVRNHVIAALLGRNLSEFPILSNAQFGAVSTSFAVLFMARRSDVGRTVLMGAVATYSDWESRDWVSFHLSDAAGGACLADTGDTTENECEQYLARVSTADILWVVDASGSMSDNQEHLSNASHTFLTVAEDLGVNWRMCVVDMTEDNDGSCCTDTGESGDRWLTAGNPGDADRFRSCIMDPAGAQGSSGGHEMGLTQMDKAIRRHMEPQQDSDFYYRPEAVKIVFFMTDETANEVDQTGHCPDVPSDPADCHFFGGCIEYDTIGCTSVMMNISLITQCSQYPGEMWSHPECSEVYRCMGDMSEDAWDPAACDSMVNPYMQLVDQYQMVAYGLAILSSDPAECSPDSGTSPPMGYKQLIDHTGGVLASLCQQDLNDTMELIISEMAGAASPLFLAHVPIPVSLAVAIERKDPQNGNHLAYEPIPRSRSEGFNFKASTNRIILVKQPMDYPPYEVVVSYSRWLTGVVGPD